MRDQSDERIKQVVKELCVENELAAAMKISIAVFNQTPRELLGDIITDEPKAVSPHQAAVELGRRGGLKGGKARAEKLSDERRKAIAKKASEVRWRKAS